MVKRSPKVEADQNGGTCIDCVHCYDHHELTVHEHKPFMGRCPFRQWAVFLYWDSCPRLKKKRKQ